jgi:hypothetical protein
MKNNSIFWNIASFSPLKINRRFGGICSLHLQGRRIIQARNQYGYVYCLLPASFLLRLFFIPENGCNMFIRNVGWLSMDYTVLYPRRWNFHHWHSFKSRFIYKRIKLFEHLCTTWDETTLLRLQRPKMFNSAVNTDGCQTYMTTAAL